MSYRIRYGNMTTVNYYQDKTKARTGIKSIVTILLCCLLLFAVIHYKDVLTTWILPGDAAVTSTALSMFGENIRSGIPLRDAVTAFCQEIINGAIC